MSHLHEVVALGAGLAVPDGVAVAGARVLLAPLAPPPLHLRPRALTLPRQLVALHAAKTHNIFCKLYVIKIIVSVCT